jgi:(2R)-3-sulfolactate dehydrogenase (NADP+)
MHASLPELVALCTDALTASRTSADNAAEVAAALVAAEADGLQGHGLSRVASYAAQARSGKVDGHARPRVERIRAAALRVDAGNGFAYPALSMAIEALAELLPGSGIAAAAINRSHHFGAAGYHVERMAARGLIGLLVGNSPRAIAPWGGRSPLFGTNPIAFAAPRRQGAPLVIDMSLSKVARGKVMLAAKSGEAIPPDWALDADGRPTTDAEAALAGSMLAMGDAKGSALVLMVEILAAAVANANFGFEASSFFDAEGEPPGVGQFLLAIDADAFSGGQFDQRLECLLAAIVDQAGARLPGARRLARREQARRSGIDVDDVLYDEIKALAEGG